MLVRVLYGPDTGREKEFPHHVGLAIVEAGRGERVDPNAEPSGPRTDTAQVAVPDVTSRDPDVAGAAASTGLAQSVRRAVKRGRRR